MVIFILFLIAIVLIIFNINAIRKENSNSFTSVLKERQDNLTDYDLKLGEIRREYAENITEVQKEIEELRKQISEITKKDEIKHDILDNGASEQQSLPISNKSDDKKSEEIKKLLNEGKSDDEICEITGLGKGEILLIKGILKY